MDNESNNIDILSELIKISKDGEEGFQTSANLIKDGSIKKIFLERADEYKKAILILQSKIEELGVSSIEKTSIIAGILRRGWLNIKTISSGDRDAEILKECEEAERVAKEVYTIALEQDLPESIHEILQNQYEKLSSNYLLICKLKNIHDSLNR